MLNYTEHIHVVSPAITNQIAQWVETQRITYLEKRFEPTDIEEADMVIAATNHSEVNEEVRLSVPEHVLFNHAEQAELGNVTFPNVFRRDRLTISVSTEGASPKLDNVLLII